MAVTAIPAEELPQDVRELAELLLQMPRIDAAVGAWSVELVAVGGQLERILRKQSVGAKELASEPIAWPIPPESPPTG